MYEHRDKSYWLYKIKEDNKRINESLLCAQSQERFEVAESIIVRLRNLTQSLQAYIKKLTNLKFSKNDSMNCKRRTNIVEELLVLTFSLTFFKT